MVMEKLHGASNNWASKFLFGFITVTFVISSMAGYLYSRIDSSAAKVNGEEISQQAFQNQYNIASQNLSPQEADSPTVVANLKRQVLSSLIDQELLRQYVKDLKLGVSDERIKQEIVTTPSFQNNGKFDNVLYQQLLQSNGISAETYAGYVREALRLEQLQSGLGITAFTVPVQQETLAKLFFQRRDVRLATLSLADEIAKQTVSAEEIQAYYDAHKADFTLPESVKVQYLDLSGANMEKNINISDVEIAQYYQDNKSQFTTQGQQRLAHIEVKTEQQAQDLYQQLQNGADFATLAKNHSIDPISAEKGGDLSWVSAGEFPKVFEDAANALEVGKFSQPVKLDNSYHIILVEERKDSAVLPLERVKPQIVAQIRQNLVNNQFFSVEKRVAEKAFEDSSSLNTAAEAGGVKVQETGYFSRKDIPAALNYPNVVSAIFDSDISQGGSNSEPMSIGDQHSIVIRVLEHKAESVKSLDEAKNDITARLKRQKAEAVVLAEANKLVQELTVGQTVDSLKFGATQSLVFAENNDPMLHNAVFAMPKPAEGKAVYQATKETKGDIVVIALDKVVDGALSEQEQQQFTVQLVRADQIALQNNLLNALRAKAKIEINDSVVDQEQ
ncbi:SurA protein [Aggregatibacter actinomycetemcomitans serotype e str. SC1083]|uniref:Periplasmic chaperone PpiD n=1 Tax=Aggregatibacter actinomycetemcomitans serotype e str. SC1083 TaxID=907488 RepID=G4AA48_AGGAC|nr:peptidylprolyl isomerase [Aggregatibacter actinomycetemcomitans]EGY33160.1 SurA protein [Aggregatibacter actinomycetemcomitans serotype e str. SC1083]KYK76412.1 peptidylprolyl isomerase [Aggregatibacter actinomycetemcomitans serotype e str. SA3096]KYK82597.1 peptidylprolyl isomerase [Aggregatibacter actinomycetemcomitans serotype e str. SC936]KYK93640.1 peptidylprolyl isomerase [Aggregatibacter actinomycetemcomitans serotype e str. ANH9776]TYB20788.1 peptidylprolyl isomerase [Aggregatibacte